VLESARPSSAEVGLDAATVTALLEEPPEEYHKRGIGIVAWIAIAWLVLIALVAILAPLLPLKDPLFGVDYAHTKAAPFTAGHLLGTDDSGGRDVLSRAIWGARSSLLIGLGSIIVGVVVGGLVGLVAGYVGGRTDAILSACFNIILAFPQLILALVLVAVFAPGDQSGGAKYGHRLIVVIIAVGIISIPVLARITRANALAWSEREFVMAARAQGATSARVMFREVLPNVLPAMMSIALLGVAIVIVLEGALAIFGLSIPEPNPSWGNMINSQLGSLDSTPWVWLTPSFLIFFTVLALNYLGDVIRAKFDVRESVL
jgi:peptide/nickel transport system permease protein